MVSMSSTSKAIFPPASADGLTPSILVVRAKQPPADPYSTHFKSAGMPTDR